MAADNADVLAADNADVLAADTTDVLAADKYEACKNIDSLAKLCKSYGVAGKYHKKLGYLTWATMGA